MKTGKMRLYGRLVPAEDYAKIKRIAGALFGVTPINMPSDRAMKIAMKVAISSLDEMRKATSSATSS